jgi:hypothetical protein
MRFWKLIKGMFSHSGLQEPTQLPKPIQPPKPTQEDVEKIVRRDFPPDKFTAVMNTLSSYGLKDWHREVPRVRLAILKLAKGDWLKVQSYVDIATSDFRDVLGEAEYPAYVAHLKSGRRVEGLPHDEQQQVAADDSSQYVEWLRKESK